MEDESQVWDTCYASGGPTGHCNTAPHGTGPGLLHFSCSESSTQTCRPRMFAGPSGTSRFSLGVL